MADKERPRRNGDGEPRKKFYKKMRRGRSIPPLGNIQVGKKLRSWNKDPLRLYISCCSDSKNPLLDIQSVPFNGPYAHTSRKQINLHTMKPRSRHENTKWADSNDFCNSDCFQSMISQKTKPKAQLPNRSSQANFAFSCRDRGLIVYKFIYFFKYRMQMYLLAACVHWWLKFMLIWFSKY